VEGLGTVTNVARCSDGEIGAFPKKKKKKVDSKKRGGGIYITGERPSGEEGKKIET